jgi:hypothetical protein
MVLHDLHSYLIILLTFQGPESPLSLGKVRLFMIPPDDKGLMSFHIYDTTISPKPSADRSRPLVKGDYAAS